ncbi:MAG: hypothetical protein P8Q36_18535 [Alphaproteobacteria bacterium]|jgi:hypothetical protein|nr:hypothetical protein [Rhodospirillaceae bacterium]MDG2482837.1 hypothetical protein [Alphaproteobacteria bacterium]MBT6202277.1 hypothetical protein [Rhodospirillaceae bacterium]MBT6509375.1 hypothetical protein [Rhodospirillaceae bacterium]MBT7615286.1 hypothetical protein [Rhodospirillaceae bacterium]
MAESTLSIGFTPPDLDHPVLAISVDEAEFSANNTAMHEHFRDLSTLQGMTLNDREIHKQCWGAVVAKLVAIAADPSRDSDAQTRRFVEMGLCFLSFLAFGSREAGTEIAISASREGDVLLRTTPRRLIGRNKVELGNYINELASAASILGQPA